jgi:membrane protease YdiL (CAAX protease family)
MQATKLWSSNVVASRLMRNDLAIVVCGFVVMQLALVAAGVPFAGVITIVCALALSRWRLHRQASSWRAIGLGRPGSLPHAVAAALGWAAVAYLAAGIMQTVVTRVLHWPAPDVSRYGALSGNLPRLLLLLATAWTTAAFGEELLFRGFLITRLAALLGKSRTVNIVAIVIQALLFGIAHAFQGPTGMLTALTIGLVFGVAYVRSRSLWPIIIAHGLIDTFGLVVLYFAGKAGP